MKVYKILMILWALTVAGGAVFAEDAVEPEKIYEIQDHKSVVEIAANVPDVNVFLNETFQGRTNLTVYDLTPGYYLLRLEKAGYEPCEVTVFVKPHYGQRYFFEITKCR